METSWTLFAPFFPEVRLELRRRRDYGPGERDPSSFEARWYAVDVASCKFAASLLRNDVTPLQLPRVFTPFMHYASDRGGDAKRGEQRGA